VRCGVPPPADPGAAAGRAGEAAAVTAGEAATAGDRPSVAGSASAHSPKEQKVKHRKIFYLMKNGSREAIQLGRVPDRAVLTGEETASAHYLVNSAYRYLEAIQPLSWLLVFLTLSGLYLINCASAHAWKLSSLRLGSRMN
jgi:hypothetical protein